MLVPPIGHVVHVWQTKTERLRHFNRVEIPHPQRSHFPDYTGLHIFHYKRFGILSYLNLHGEAVKMWQ